MKLPVLPEQPPPFWPRFSGSARGTALTARVGRVLGIAFGICFATGLLSHYQYGPWKWLPEPASPVWGYRLTQGVHVITGIAIIPLLLVKLWSVYPKFFTWPPARSLVHGLERLSVAVLVSSALVQVVTGFLNVLNWYPWAWNFINVHYWLAWVATGSILLHIAVQLPAIRRGLGESLDTPDGVGAGTQPDDGPRRRRGITRRGVLLAGGAGVGIVAVTTAGHTVTPLRSLGLLAPRQPQKAPNGVPINRTAAQARITVSPNYHLDVIGPHPFSLTLDEVEALPTVDEQWPIACVEGWSASARWTGFRLLDLVQRAGGTKDTVVVVHSIETNGAYRASRVEGPHLEQGLLATHIDGARLSADHGYPLRLICPDRAGVLNTKWITQVTFL